MQVTCWSQTNRNPILQANRADKLKISSVVIYLFCFFHFMLQAAKANATQPAKKAAPPIGVMAPKNLISVKLRAYKLPEKIAIPMINSHPLANRAGGGESLRLSSNATTKSARA